VECQSADGMHQTFTLQTRRQTKRDGVRAEQAEQDACGRNLSGKAHVHVQMFYNPASAFVTGAPNNSSDAAEGATAWLRDSVNPEGRLYRQAGRKRLTGRQKHPTHLA
jgi:hypothetical protein